MRPILHGSHGRLYRRIKGKWMTLLSPTSIWVFLILGKSSFKICILRINSFDMNTYILKGVSHPPSRRPWLSGTSYEEKFLTARKMKMKASASIPFLFLSCNFFSKYIGFFFRLFQVIAVSKRIFIPWEHRKPKDWEIMNAYCIICNLKDLFDFLSHRRHYTIFDTTRLNKNATNFFCNFWYFIIRQTVIINTFLKALCLLFHMPPSRTLQL